MRNLLLKFKHHPILYTGILTILFCMAHAPLLKNSIHINTDYSEDAAFSEDKNPGFSDCDSYLQSTLSLLEFKIEKKFNNKFNLIFPQSRYIYDADMPFYAKYFLVFYPYPFFRFGYSFIAALMTGLFPQAIFQYNIHRLIFVNIMLMILSLNLIFLILRRLIKNNMAAFIACLFYIFDVSHAYNSYFYLAHTSSALFYLLCSFYIIMQSRCITPLKLFSVCLLLTLSISVLSSPYLILVALFTGLFICGKTCYKQEKLKILEYSFAATIGFLVLPLYIIIVEKLFKFELLGLPTVLNQLSCLLVSDFKLVNTTPVHLRFMWDLRLFNIFILPILSCILLIISYEKLYLNKIFISKQNILNFLRAFRSFIFANPARVLLYSISVILTLIMAIFYMIPISRAMTPYTVLIGVLTGSFLGKKFVKGDMIIRVVVVTVILLLIFNFYIILQIIDIPKNHPSDNIFTIDESETIYNNAFNFAKIGRYDTCNYRIISKSLGEFIQVYDNELSVKENVYIKFDAFDLVTTYSQGWRLNEILASEGDAVTKDTYLRDFRLIAEIFELYNKKLLLDKDIIPRKKTVFDFSLWSSEYNYIYGYCRLANKFFKGTPLEPLDTHCNYYINYRALKNAFLKL